MSNINHFELIFNPKNVAVVGATANESKVGSLVVSNIKACGYTKDIFCVNPSEKYKGKKIFGLEVYPKLTDIPVEIDLATIVVPPEEVAPSLEDCVSAGIRAAVIITAGFKEVDKEREQVQDELVYIAKRGKIRFVGPNSMGIYGSADPESPIHAGMGFMTPRPGDISIASQSGSFGTMLCNYLKRIRYFVSTGNEASILMEDYLEFFGNDPGTKVISIFVEGLRDAKRFHRIAKELCLKKPIVFFKAGLTKAGKKAASSHTASVGGSEEIYLGMFKQNGILQAEEMDEFIFLSKAAKFLNPYPRGNRVGILSGGGGFGVYLSDKCEKGGLVVATIDDPKIIDRIGEHLPFYWSHNNPVDTVATWDFSVFPKILKIMMDYEGFDIIITQSMVGMGDMFSNYKPMDPDGIKRKEFIEKMFQKMELDLAKKQISVATSNPNKIVVLIAPNYSPVNSAFELYDDKQLLVTDNPKITIEILRKLIQYRKFLETNNIS